MRLRRERYANASDAPESLAADAFAWFAAQTRTFDASLWTDWWRSLAPVIPGSFISMDPWPCDYQVAQGLVEVPSSAGTRAVSVLQAWSCDAPLDAWPRLEADAIRARLGGVQATNSERLDELLAAARPAPYVHAEPLNEFLANYESCERTDAGSVRDAPLMRVAFVRAWLHAALGPALAAIVLSPIEDTERIAAIARYRVDAAAEAGRFGPRYAFDALYHWEMTESGFVMVTTHQGLSHNSHRSWQSLGRPWREDDLAAAVRVTAGLLVSPPLLAALLDASRSGGLQAILALTVLRRWALTLRALAWLDQARMQRFDDLRLSDVVTFAYASLAPWWPRPSLVISHRSRDAKPALMALGLWESPHVAVDAATNPGLETNTGFIWRLFAGTPLIVRVRSEGYDVSPWCRREAELTSYLIGGCDFLRGRGVADIAVRELSKVGAALAGRLASANSADALIHYAAAAYPAPLLVLEVPSYPPLVIAMLTAVATLRLLNVLLDDVERVNRIAAALTHDTTLDLPAPTNHSGGWETHRKAFRLLAAHEPTAAVAVRLADDYAPEERARDRDALAHRIPDLRAGIPSGEDVLPALEWNREVRYWFAELDERGERAVIDCRGLDVIGWRSDAEHAIKRGMAQLETNAVVFIEQDAGQEAHSWPGIADADTPILTHHLDGQFGWMRHCHALSNWILVYTSLPTLRFASGVRKALINALNCDFDIPGWTPPKTYADVFGMNVSTARMYDPDFD